MNLQTMRKIFPNVMCFSESPNFKGKGGWSEKEIQNFESLKNKMERIRAKGNVKKRKHIGEQKLWRARVLRKQKEWQDFQSKVNKLRQVERPS